MSVAYIESFRIRGALWGIEDHEDGRPDADHFFPDHYRRGTNKRFHLWRSGSGFGQADTLEEAREKLIAYVRQRAAEDKAAAEAVVADCRKVLGDLNGSTVAAGLGPYRVANEAV